MKAHLDAVTPNNPYVSPYAYPVPYVGLTGDEYATQQSKKKQQLQEPEQQTIHLTV